jgi:hypothetical protein
VTEGEAYMLSEQFPIMKNTIVHLLEVILALGFTAGVLFQFPSSSHSTVSISCFPTSLQCSFPAEKPFHVEGSSREAMWEKHDHALQAAATMDRLLTCAIFSPSNALIREW